ncbi:MAG: NAD(+) diphosphatase [Solirubrobacteraceae bacterium]
MSTVAFAAHMQWPESDRAAAALRLCVRGTEVLVQGDQDAGGVRLPARPPDGITHVLGSLGARACLAVDGTDRAAPDGMRWSDLRTLYRLMDETLWAIAGRAVQVVEWDRTHRFCGRCGTPTVPSTAERVRRCPNCWLHAYPRVSPAIIVLVTRGRHDEEALLAWGNRRQQAFYSTLAGFVEPGETLEEALQREIKEEVGIDVTDISYFGSQSWPFPHQLMVGYRARYAGGELVLQESEIREARWFAPDDVKQEQTAVRGRFSIAGKLIDGWLAEQDGGHSG